MLSHKVGELPVLRVELDDAYPVLDFLRRNVATVGMECGVVVVSNVKKRQTDILYMKQ